MTLVPVAPRYVVVFENPDEPESPVRVLHPAPHWLAKAMAGGYLPPIEVRLRDQAKIASWLAAGNDPQQFSWDNVGGAESPDAEPIGPMTEEEAMEYLIMKDIPPQVWAVQRNRPAFKIVRRGMIPSDRTNRNAWRLADVA